MLKSQAVIHSARAFDCALSSSAGRICSKSWLLSLSPALFKSFYLLILCYRFIHFMITLLHYSNRCLKRPTPEAWTLLILWCIRIWIYLQKKQDWNSTWSTVRSGLQRQPGTNTNTLTTMGHESKAISVLTAHVSIKIDGACLVSWRVKLLDSIFSWGSASQAGLRAGRCVCTHTWKKGCFDMSTVLFFSFFPLRGLYIWHVPFFGSTVCLR